MTEHWLFTLYNHTQVTLHAYAFGSSEFMSNKRREILDKIMDEYEAHTKSEDRLRLPPPVRLGSKLSTAISTVRKIYSSINPDNKIAGSKNYYCVFVPFSTKDNDTLFNIH